MDLSSLSLCDNNVGSEFDESRAVASEVQPANLIHHVSDTSDVPQAPARIEDVPRILEIATTITSQSQTTAKRGVTNLEQEDITPTITVEMIADTHSKDVEKGNRQQAKRFGLLGIGNTRNFDRRVWINQIQNQ